MSSEWKKLLEEAKKIRDGLDEKTLKRASRRMNYAITSMERVLLALEIAERGGVIEDWSKEKEILLPERERLKLAQFLVRKYANDVFTVNQLYGEKKFVEIMRSPFTPAPDIVPTSYRMLRELFEQGIIKKRIIEEIDDKGRRHRVTQYTPTQKAIEAIGRGFVKDIIPVSEESELVITPKDLSFYGGSGVNFKDLVNSSDQMVRHLARELHSGRKKDSYIALVKDIHSRASSYHNIKCKGKPPISCAWNCDVWNLLHLCLYLMEKSN